MVMSETLPLAEIKAHLSEIVDRVEREHERVVVTRNGRPAAVIMSPADLAALEDTLELLSDPAALEEIRAAREDIARAGWCRPRSCGPSTWAGERTGLSAAGGGNGGANAWPSAGGGGGRHCRVHGWGTARSSPPDRASAARGAGRFVGGPSGSLPGRLRDRRRPTGHHCGPHRPPGRHLSAPLTITVAEADVARPPPPPSFTAAVPAPPLCR